MYNIAKKGQLSTKTVFAFLGEASVALDALLLLHHAAEYYADGKQENS